MLDTWAFGLTSVGLRLLPLEVWLLVAKEELRHQLMLESLVMLYFTL